MSKCVRSFIESVKEHFESMPMLTESEEHILEEANLLLEAEDDRLKTEKELDEMNR